MDDNEDHEFASLSLLIKKELSMEVDNFDEVMFLCRSIFEFVRKDPDGDCCKHSQLLETAATRIYKYGCRAEACGQLNQAAIYYKFALKLSPNIESILRSFPIINAHSCEAVHSHEKPSDNLDLDPLIEGESLVTRFNRKLIEERSRGQVGYCLPEVGSSSKNHYISHLPYEILLKIMRFLVGNQPDINALGRFGGVCRGFFLLSRDPLIWRSICHKLWDARQIYQEVANGREDKKRRRQRRRQSFRKQDRSLVNSTEKFPAKAIVWRRLQPSEETPVGPLTLVLPSCELGGGHAVTILPPPTTPSASEFQGPTRCGYDSWFQLAMQQPRILFDGCYLSRVEYTRSTNCAEMGLERLLVVRYFRALRFLSSRRILFVNSPFSAIHIVNVLTNLARHLQSSVTCLPPTIFEMGQTEATDLRTMVLTEAESGESCNDDPTAGNSRQRQSRVDLKDSIMIGSYTFIGFDRVCFYVALCAALFTLYWLILVISLPMFWSLYRSISCNLRKLVEPLPPLRNTLRRGRQAQPTPIFENTYHLEFTVKSCRGKLHNKLKLESYIIRTIEKNRGEIATTILHLNKKEFPPLLYLPTESLLEKISSRSTVQAQ